MFVLGLACEFLYYSFSRTVEISDFVTWKISLLLELLKFALSCISLNPCMHAEYSIK